jgi:UDP-galactopyranose mutase
MFDYIIAGSGLAGSVVAERIATVLNKKVLVVEKKNHIGGNVYDYYDEQQVLVHKYGPHIFHTNLKQVWDYLSQFTKWNVYHHTVLGEIDGKQVPIPFNINTMYEVFPKIVAERLEEKLINIFGYNVKVPILNLMESNDSDLKFLSDYIYEKIFLHYTTKQWDCKPENLDPAVTGRVPVYIGKDNRYFQDKYQGMPANGYTRMIENLLLHHNIKLMLNTDAKEIIDIDFDDKQIKVFGQHFSGQLIYTGQLDELMNYRYGELPYRSLMFEFQNLEQEYFQKAGTINYPNNYDFTRITEFKHLTGQKCAKTTIIKEFPKKYDQYNKESDIPYYPIPNADTLALHGKYREQISQFNNIKLAGRLADYTYYDMDKVVDKALAVFEEIRG